jgi:hypothetical protein
MTDSDAYTATLRRAIALLQMQLALLPPHDRRRADLDFDLWWCHNEAFTLLWQRIAAQRATPAA